VVGAVGELDAPVFRRMLHHSMPALAVALDVEAWGGRPGSGPATPILTGQGWRAVTLGPRDRLATVWQDLGVSNARAARGPGDPRTGVFR
jgi:hypothetical protein